MSVIEIKNDKLTVGINSIGSEILYIKGASGTDFLWNGDENVWSGRAPVLFPICGGLKEDKYTFNGKKYSLPKHGFGRKSEFEGKLISDKKVEFILKSNEETLKNYPFEFILKIVFELEDNKIKVSNKVENLSEGAMYFSIGAHEGYSCPEGIEEYYIEFDEEVTLDSFILDGNLLENNSIRILDNQKKLPLKYEYFEIDALVFKNVDFHKATLKHKNSSKEIIVEFEDSEYFLLWTKPEAKYICLEPWNGIQDIVDSDYDITKKEGIIELEKGGMYEVSHTITFIE